MENWKRVEDNRVRKLVDELELVDAEINLTSEYLGAEGAVLIANFLKRNKCITKIDLSRTSINDNGAKFIAEALEVNDKITEINLSGNLFGNKGSQYIANALKKNKRIIRMGLEGILMDSRCAADIKQSLTENYKFTFFNIFNCLELEKNKNSANTHVPYITCLYPHQVKIIGNYLNKLG